MGALMLALGVLQKGHCVVNGWSTPDQFWRACYSDIAVINASSMLAQRDFPYSGDTPSEQPLLSGLMMWALSWLSPYSGGDRVAQQWVFGVWAALAMLLLVAGVLAVVAARHEAPWQSAHVAVSPLIAVLALISVDLLGIALVLAAVYHWSRHHPRVSGVLLGMSFLVRPLSAVFCIAVVVISLRRGQVRSGVTVLISAALTAVALYLPFLLVIGEPMLAAPRAWLSAAPGYGALILLPSLSGAELAPQVAPVLALLGWCLAIGLGWWLSRHLSEAPSLVALGAVAAVMLLVVTLTATSVSVQTGLWVLPVLALSLVTWRDHLIWAAVEIVHFEAVWLYIGFGADRGRGLPPEAYAFTVVARAIAWSYICVRVCRLARPASRPAQGSTSTLPDVPPEAKARWASASSVKA